MHVPAILIAVVLILLAGVGYAFERIATQANLLGERRGVSGQVTGLAGEPLRVSYSVGVDRFETARLTPLSPLLPGEEESEAARFRDRLDSGESLTVWYPPARPERGFLVPEARVWPYAAVLASLALGMVTLGALQAGGVLEARPHAVPRGRHGWNALASGPGPGEIAAVAAGVAGLWYVVTAGLLLHFVAGVDGSPLHAAAVGLPAALLGLWPVGVAWSRWRTAGPMQTPRVTAMQPGVRLDLPVIVRVEWAAAQRVQLESVTTTLACARRTGLSSLTLFRTSKNVSPPVTLEPGQRLTRECEFEVPAKKRRGSTPFKRWVYPRTDWLVELAAKPRATPTVRHRFPLEAVTTADAEPAAETDTA